MNNLEWLVGREASAVRKPGSKHWSIMENKDLPSYNPTLLDARTRSRALNIGVMFLLNHPKKALKDDPSVYFQNKLMSKFSFSPSIPAIGALVVLFSILVLWSTFMIQDYEVRELAKFNWPSLFVFFGGFLFSSSLMSWIEARWIGSKLSENSPLLHFTIMGVACNPVPWALGTFWKEALGLLIVNAVVLFGAWSILPYDLYLGLGCILGFSFWLAYALMPLKPGPIDVLLKKVFNINEYPHQLLKWSIEGKVMPAGQKIETHSSWTLFTVSLYLVVWVYALLKFLEYIGSQLPESFYANAIFLEMFVSVSGVLISVFFLAAIAFFYLKAWAFNKSGEVEEYSPSEEEIEYWKKTSSLLYHVPILRQAEWNWQKVSEATWLIKKGEETRRFYWLQKGEAKVYGRRSKGTDINQLAKLHSGSGFGELALLDNTPRNADVLISKDSIVAYLDVEEFERVSNDFYREHFRRIVQASQLFDQLEMFRSTPSRDREEWLSRAILLDFNIDDVLYEEGDLDQWMGLVLEGEIRVERNGEEVAHIKRGQIFGEMSYIVDEPRKATLIAASEVVIFRWESGWWAEQASKVGLESYFNSLMQRRQLNNNG